MRISHALLRGVALVAVAAVLSLSQACDRGPAVGPVVDAPLAAAMEEVYTVGARPAEDWENFGRIGGVAFNAAGELSVLDIQGHRIVVVGSDGGHVRTFGRRGDAPGELRRPFSFTVLADGRTVVFDYGWPAGFEIYGPDGSFERSAGVDIRQGAPGTLLLPMPDGRLASAGGPRFSLPRSGDGSSAAEDHRRDIHAFSLDGTDTEVLYRAWGLPPAETEATVENEDGRREVTFARMRAFEPGLHLAVLADGRLAVADSTAYAVKLIDVGGGVTGTFGRPVAPAEVTNATRDAARAQRTESISASPGFALVGRQASTVESPQLREAMMQQVEGMVFADEIPVIADMAVDWDGRIWIQRSPAEVGGDPLIDILTPRGDYVGTLPAGWLAVPDAFGPNGLMAHVEADQLGVQRVRVVRMVALEGS